MKKILKNAIIAFVLLLMPSFMFGQIPPNLGVASEFVMFTTVGAMTNTGISQLTGNVGTNNGAVSGFGNVNGVMTYTSDALSALCSADLLLAYGELNSQVPTDFPANSLGGDTLISGVYSITGATTLNGVLTLDGQNNPNAVFVFQIQGPFSTGANSKIKLINGAKACNVFWKVEGLVDMATGTFMKGTIIANNAAINMSTGDTLEGRALSIGGAVVIDGVMAYTPVGCGSPALLGPAIPSLSSALCYTIFSASGPVTNAGITFVTGDVGTNVGLTSGFDALNVIGAIHPIPDGSTAAAAADLLNAYTYTDALPYDIELLYPAQFGNNLVLTPHTYLMNGAVTFTDNVYLNAMGDSNAVFVIKTYGAFETSTYSNVILMNGTKPENVYWMVSGAVTINDYSIFNGTIICNNGAMNLNTGVTLNGRALTTTGAIETASITAIMPPGCLVSTAPAIITEPMNLAVCEGDSAVFTVVATGSDLTYQWRKGNVDLVNGANISGATSDSLVIFPATILDNANNYNVVVSGSLSPDDISINASLIVNTTPVITTQPVNQTECIGNHVSFSVVATGTNLSYQWRKGNVNLMDGVTISGATSDVLTINPTSILDTASNYNVIVSNSCSADTSINVSLNLNIAPVIVTQPINQTVCLGNSASFSVVATGTSLSYQWRKGNVDLVNGANISGATSDTLTINPTSILDTASNYNVIVTNVCSADTSIYVSLVLEIAPIITTQPISQTECTGNSVNFSVVASGTNLSYQWRKGNVNLIDGVNISGSTSDTLTINPTSILDTASNYNVIVSNSCSADTSINVSLNLNIAPVIVTQPINQTVCLGNSAIFSVVATGTSLSYQWRKGNVDLIDGVNISGATSDILTINPTSILDTASNYNVIVTNVCSADTSIYVSLILETAPIITTQPIDQSACAGNAVNFSVVATGSNLTYQWRKGLVDLVNGGNVSGATTALLTIYPAGILDVASDYNVVVSGACAPSVTSVNASLTIDAEPVVITEPVNQFICVGDSVSFTIVATGANLTYQWRKGNINIVDGGNISGATTATLTINPALFSDTASNYNVILTGGCSAADTTAINLNSANEFGILAGVGISSTGFSVISDMNIGISPGVRSQITGFPPATVVNGSIYASDDIAPPGVAAMLEQAKLDLTNAYLFAEGATAPAPATVAGDQGGLTLAPGIYKSTSTLLIQSGDLTLDAQGNANAKWIFQIASDFTTIGGAGGNVILAGGAQAKNVTWQVGSSATIGDGTSFKGNILALTSITMNTGSSIDGKLLARNGSVVLSGTNLINSPSDTLTNSSIDTSNFVSLTVYPLPVADAGPDKTILMGNNTNIGTPELLGNTYAWTPIVGLNASTDAEPIASPIVTTTYVLTVNSIYGCANTDTVTVFVLSGSNNAPLANNDTMFMCQDGGLITINVQSNDSDPDGDLLTTSIYTAAIHGVSVLNGNAINYTPGAGFSGIDTIIYVICDDGAPSLCDTAKVFIHVVSTEVIYVTTFICDGDSIFLAGAYRALAGIYTENLTSALGCDSIIQTTLIVNPAYLDYVSASICDGDSIFLAGAYRTLPGIYIDPLTNAFGCDSIIQTTLIVNPAYLTNLSASICDGDSIFIAGAYRTLAGIYTENLTTALGCDSIIQTTLIVNPAYLTNLSASICDGDSIFLAGAYRTLPGIYTESLTTTLGCDSIVQTTLIVNPLPIATITPDGATTFCDGNSVVLTSSIGSSYLWNTAQTSQSITVSTSGSYSVTVTNEFGCTASSVSTIVTVNPLPIATITPNGATTFCDGNSVVLTSSIGSSYLWNTAQTSQSITVSTSGSYSVTVTNEFGCTASSVSTVVTVTPLPIAGFTYSVADLFTYTFANTSVNASTYAWDFGDAHNSTFANPTNVYAGAGVYTVSLVAYNACGSDTAIQVISIVKDISDVDFFNGFSPNGDGQNDYWNIPILDYYPVNSVLIINRWGSEVWKGINYDNDNVRWTGQNMNNNDLPDGTYFYIIEYGEVSKRGWVFIKR
ncbi:MAG: ice-binding family protein [Bacteroidales bacterium]|nr:ice-binding family protein [Bacteroidales bacterium]